ncbi:hypothetical protein GCM10023148_24590 [Actinokineospora soli]
MYSAFDDINASLAPIAGPPPPPGPGGPPTPKGRFVFRPDEIRALVKDWLALGDEYTPSIASAREMFVVAPPGKEPVSTAYAASAQISTMLYLKSLKEKRAYCYRQAQKLHDSLNDYLGIERVNLRTIDTADEGVDMPGGRT